MSPKYLYDHWFKIEANLRRTSKIFLMLDYDGTITPIVKKPELAVLKPKTRKILKKIVLNKEKFKVAIISGRSIKQLKKLVSLSGLYYVGVHGLEIRGPRLNFTHKDAAKFKPLLVKLRGEIAKDLGKISGVLIENKGLSIAIHYRLTPKKNLPFIFKSIFKIQARYESLKLLRGKKVFEVLPQVEWDKGSAALFLLKKHGSNFTPIYFGDDKTDENVFKVFRGKGLTIVVGKRRNSLAEYYVKNISEVQKFLQKLLVLP